VRKQVHIFHRRINYNRNTYHSYIWTAQLSRVCVHIYKQATRKIDVQLGTEQSVTLIGSQCI
jgi:hypothetical protein